MSSQLVLMDHDGAIDDFLAMMLLLTMKEVRLLGVVVTPADCYIKAALNVTRKILHFMGKNEIPVAESTVRGINPFPAIYRRDCLIIDHFPLLNTWKTLEPPLVSLSGEEFMVQVLRQAPEPVTLMVTGPLTTVAAALTIAPDIVAKIARIIWMGGALNVGGNVEKVFAPEHDGTAEWNAFWDPMAVGKIWQTSIPIVLCPLDITNTVPVTGQFIRQLSQQRQYSLSDLAGLCYALAMPQDYYCWDVLATAYLGCPQLYNLGTVEAAVITEGESEGRIYPQKGDRSIAVIESVAQEQFYNYLLQQWQFQPS